TAPAVRPGLGVGNSGGQAVDELGARAGPSLRAATLPPCNSTKDFTGARPSPSPRALLPVAGALPERVGHPRQQLGGGPPAVVPHPQDGLPGFLPLHDLVFLGVHCCRGVQVVCAPQRTARPACLLHPLALIAPRPRKSPSRPRLCRPPRSQ